jgi:predicted nucleic acid-binding protein
LRFSTFHISRMGHAAADRQIRRMIRLDTNAVLEAMRPAGNRDANVAAWLRRNGPLPLFVSSITEAELWLGVTSLPDGKRRSALEERTTRMLSDMFAGRILAFESRAALAYGKIFGTRKVLGRPIGHEDCAIAAIAQVNGLTLATRNTDDFAHCNVTLINPWGDGT